MILAFSTPRSARMCRTKPFLSVLLCVLAVLCPLALTSCPGNGELDGTDNDTYTPGGGIIRGGD